ncbi:MAG: hypothetical protein FWG40_12475, partial [Peptococcaceae bacterium]|nr:hypothetical protein [Peptococcaceae bacterium]
VTPPTIVPYTPVTMSPHKNTPKQPEIQQTIYTYDAAGQQTTIQYPNGIKEHRTYDKAGQLTKIHESNATHKIPKPSLKYQYKYDPQGNIIYEYKTKIHHQHEEKNTYAYDALDRLISSQDKNKPQITYDYDTVGNLIQETEHRTKIHKLITEYTYNNLNQQTTRQDIDRLISSKGKTSDKLKDTQLNNYDNRGNLIRTERINEPTKKDPAPPNTILAQYEYDSHNRMVKGTNEKQETSEYHHNILGALVGETKHIAKDAYGYKGVDATPTTDFTTGPNSGSTGPNAGPNSGPDSTITSKTSTTPNCCKDKTKTKTAHIEISHTIDYTSPLLDKLVTKETNGLTYKHVYGTEQISVDIIEESKKKIDVDTYYVHHDRQGSVDSLTGKLRTIRSSAGYDPWGAPKKSDPLLTDCRKIDLVTEFTTYSYDPILGEYNAKARMYDPGNKRYQGQDIIEGTPEEPQTLNRYTYVGNNPRTHIDPTGELWLVDKLKDAAKTVVNTVATVATAVKDTVVNVVKEVKKVVEDVATAVVKTTAAIYEKGKEVVQTAVQTVKEVASDIGDKISQVNWSDVWAQASPWVHGILDIAGMIPIPGLSVITGAVNGLIYLAEGNYEEAAWSVVGMIPGGKLVGKAGKMVAKGIKVAQHGRGMTDGLTALKDGDYQGAAMAFGSMALGGKKMGRGGSGGSSRSGFAQGPGNNSQGGRTHNNKDKQGAQESLHHARGKLLKWGKKDKIQGTGRTDTRAAHERKLKNRLEDWLDDDY